jgi:hypothetical protein
MLKSGTKRLISGFLSAVICYTLSNYSARANDSSVELATGGLVFVKNNDIEMLSEDLFISTGEFEYGIIFEIHPMSISLFLLHSHCLI